MKSLEFLLDRTVFVRVEFGTEPTQADVYLFRRGKLEATTWEATKSTLVALVVCGTGVVTKADEAEITARVKADEQTFLWSSVAGNTSFVRRDRLAKAHDLLDAHKVVAVRAFCADRTDDFAQTAPVFTRRIYDELGWRTLLWPPTRESSAVLQTLVRRVGPAILGLLLAVLTANAVFSPRLNARRQTLQTELSKRERNRTGEAEADRRQRRLLAEFRQQPAVSRAVVCDRVARAVPERVRLTALDVEPLTKRFEAQKTLQRREQTLVVVGLAPAAGDISAFVQALSELDCCDEVQLVNVEHAREGNSLQFRIETTL